MNNKYLLMRKVVSQSFTLPPCSHVPAPYQGKPLAQLIKDRTKYMPHFYFHYYKEPLLITSGYMQYLFDHTGRRYIDLIAGIATVSVGHSHPSIVSVVSDQVTKLMHTSPIYLSENQGEYSKMLCNQLGQGFDSVYLCNSGAQATDFAINLARLYTREQKFVSLRNGYHGLVGHARSVTNSGIWNTSMNGSYEFEKLAWPNLYRGSIETVDGLIKDAEEMLQTNTTGKVAGILFECIQGVGGINPLPHGYVPRITQLIRKHKGLVICDEVQTGFGRVGTPFWGFKWQGIQPDIVTMAKGIGNGFPMAAVATRREIVDKVQGIYFNTFGGGHLQCRIGMEVLNIINKEKLHQNAELVGNYLIKELTRIGESSKYIGNVRGKGLMIGIQLVKNKETKEPAKQITAQLLELLRERGLLMGKSGPFGCVIRLQPPLCVSMADAKYIVQAFQDAMHNIK